MLKNVLVDAVNYKIEPTDEILIVDGQEAGAEVNYNLGVIKIRNEKVIGSGVRAKILMHEVMHAILHERGLFEASADEQLVDALAAGVTNLIRTNPALIEFITKNGREFSAM
ncbi:MAG: hypothetical protein IKP64_10315 [Selenomonadaceae bacterium]|nr:hypothetical protein [Selenomonadaceae bacterium]MBR4383938.1 hypothetical protein [Selenomonadaceae bacterium]